MGYDWKITAWKGVKVMLISAGLAAVTSLVNFLEVTEFPPEYNLFVGAAIAVINAGLNWYKHK